MRGGKGFNVPFDLVQTLPSGLSAHSAPFSLGPTAQEMDRGLRGTFASPAFDQGIARNDGIQSVTEA